jgi:hypothetical protein
MLTTITSVNAVAYHVYAYIGYWSESDSSVVSLIDGGIADSKTDFATRSPYSMFDVSTRPEVSRSEDEYATRLRRE